MSLILNNKKIEKSGIKDKIVAINLILRNHRLIVLIKKISIIKHHNRPKIIKTLKLNFVDRRNEIHKKITGIIGNK